MRCEAAPVAIWRVPRVSASWLVEADPLAPDWQALPALPPLVLADGTGEPVQKTVARGCWNPVALHIHFECEDRDIWSTHSRRDDPLYEEEAVEVFLSPGAEDPTEYYEFEISPAGVLFDARVVNPTSERRDLRVDTGWDCEGARWAASTRSSGSGWCAFLSIPWASLTDHEDLPSAWRANLYRIDRPRDGEPEFSAWSPTLTRPPDFHKPARFGRLLLEGG